MNIIHNLISRFNLSPHPEGGFFAETYRSESSTGIYYLLGQGDQSCFHRIKSDEMWHFYSGDPMVIVEINQKGEIKETELGANATFQYVVPANTWFGAFLKDKSQYALVGCTVSPAFHFSDFEIGLKEDLLRNFPHCKLMIERLTK
jgi:predicted cupin superfamily sugar epimerase